MRVHKNGCSPMNRREGVACPICGEPYFDEESDRKYCKKLEIYVCEDCLEKIETRHQVTGKFVVNRCSECGHVKTVTWEPYRKRGRPVGSKNAPEPEDDKQLTLEELH